MKAERHLLDNVNWQFFCTFTFKSLRVSESAWIKAFFSLLREEAENFGIHFHAIKWVLRTEHGEISARPHFHAIIAGLPKTAESHRTCFSFMAIWEKHGGGISRVRLFNPALAGVDYVLKGTEAALVSGANVYELTKFGGRCDVTLSMSLKHHLRNRKRFGHRGRGVDDESRRTDTTASTVQGGVMALVVGT